MRELLLKLGFSEKDISIYLCLLEFGQCSASKIASKLRIPKATVLFILKNLVDRSYVQRSQKGRTQYFEAKPEDLKKHKQHELQEQKSSLESVIPLLEEFKTPYSSEPKVTFYEGIENCKKAYQLILDSKTTVLEFGAHEDLVMRFGEKFMNNFITERAKRKVYLEAICSDSAISKSLKHIDDKQARHIHMFSQKDGQLYSSITIFDQKVLLLNLYYDAFAILIENQEVSATLKTIFQLVSRHLP